MCRVVTVVTSVASVLSICGFVSTTVVFLSAVEKHCLTTVLVMPEYVDLVYFQSYFIPYNTTKLQSKQLQKIMRFLAASARNVKIDLIGSIRVVNFPEI